MKWMIKLGEDCDYEDYERMLESHELDDVMQIARLVVDQFMKRFPIAEINTVALRINKDASVVTEIDTVIINANGELCRGDES